MIEALDINVSGIVQGVGFRPFVYRLAKHYLINGWVLNAVDGVFIHAEGEGDLLDQFVLAIKDEAPAAAHVERIKLKEVPLQDCTKFEIRFSDNERTSETTLVSPDLATCDDCVSELFDPENRRYRYPFINCTNCGPRFTIIDELPYDRKTTSMSKFDMCDDCAREYADPLDRRFHAQPDACFDCGPHVSWCEKAVVAAGGGDDDGDDDGAGKGDNAGNGETNGTGNGETNGDSLKLTDVSWGDTREASDAIFARAVEMLLDGKILAVKGLGGFHLVCDATNESALAELRRRKHRDGKGFAVMMRSAGDAAEYCQVDAAEKKQMELMARPIVLLKKRADVAFPHGLADGLPELGVMLPSTPVQHLLLHDFIEAGGSGMLVMTSGNVHDEPIVIDDEQAYERLGAIADGFLGNNREIRARYDDSVVRVLNLGGVDEAGNPMEAVQFIRRARGFAPAPLIDTARSEKTPCILACGPEQKNTFALTRGRQTFVSQHIGDMENADVYDAWLDSLKRFKTLFDLKPQQIALDAHPEYLSSKYAREQAEKTGIALAEVQHHHAHIASVMGEYGLDQAVCGIAFDGTGYGLDGNIWGGEVLLANRRTFERFANFAYVPMPGGAAAVKRPLRMAYGALWEFDLLDHPAAASAIEALGEEANICDQMIERGLNTPITSSVGRLFDAASALLGICENPSYEGEPAILLDAARADSDPYASTPEEASAIEERYSISVIKNSATEDSTALTTSVLLLDAAPTFKALLDDKLAGIPASVCALRFHNAFVGAIVNVAQLVNALYGISTVVLSGGVFMNRYLIERASNELRTLGFTVAINSDLPPNDGCISYGQTVVASALGEDAQS